MALQFAGQFEVQRSLEEVYDFLTDPHRFGPVLPYFQGLTIADNTHCEVKVRVGISHIRGTADVKLSLAEADHPRRLAYRGRGSLAGGSVDFSAAFDLQVNGNGSKVTWQGEAQVFGVLTSIAGGLLQPLAQKNAARAIEALRAALEETGVRNQAPGVSGQSSVVSGQLSAVSSQSSATDTRQSQPDPLPPETPGNPETP
jgi:carbon monoxide dehydrogenase subunit G